MQAIDCIFDFVWRDGRGLTAPDDIADLWISVCAHRVVLRQAGATRDEASSVLREAMESVPNPA